MSKTLKFKFLAANSSNHRARLPAIKNQSPDSDVLGYFSETNPNPSVRFFEQLHLSDRWPCRLYLGEYHSTNGVHSREGKSDEAVGSVGARSFGRDVDHCVH